MKKTTLLAVLTAIAAFTAGYFTCLKVNTDSVEAHYFKLELIEAYDIYNKHTEDLLDTLNTHYDWVDAFDPYEYYESRAKLDSLFDTQL